MRNWLIFGLSATAVGVLNWCPAVASAAPGITNAPIATVDSQGDSQNLQESSEATELEAAAPDPLDFPPLPPNFPGFPNSDDPYQRGIETEYFCVYQTGEMQESTTNFFGGKSNFCTACVKYECREHFEKDAAKQDTCINVGDATCDSLGK